MAEPSGCLGHEGRGARKNKMSKMLKFRQQSPDKNLKLLIKKGSITVETSLNELEENYAKTPSGR